MGIRGCKVEGRDSDNWKLIDAIDVIVHIFHHEQRKNYELEKMWAGQHSHFSYLQHPLQDTFTGLENALLPSVHPP